MSVPSSSRYAGWGRRRAAMSARTATAPPGQSAASSSSGTDASRGRPWARPYDPAPTSAAGSVHLPLVTGPERRAQLELLQLAGGRARQRLVELDALGTFVARQRL